MEAARANLTLLPSSGEIPADVPNTYAECVDELLHARRKIELLAEEKDNIAKAAGKTAGELQRVKGQLNKDLRLHKDYAAVERLWLEVWRPAHPKARDHVPEDWLKMALDRLKDFDEAALARALYGAIRNPPVNQKTGKVYDGWDNALRNTGNVRDYIGRADEFEGRAHRERERHPEVARVLAAVGVASLKDLENRCDRCGELMIRHGGGDVCDDPDDLFFRSERWIDEQEARMARGQSVTEVARARVALRREDDRSDGQTSEARR